MNDNKPQFTTGNCCTCTNCKFHGLTSYCTLFNRPIEGGWSCQCYSQANINENKIN